MSDICRADSPLAMRHVHLSYNPLDSQKSALNLLYTLLPEWSQSDGPVKFIRFTDGITNTLLKAEKRRPGYTQDQVDEEAVLLRAYGEGTDILIDREREIKAHLMLSAKGLGPSLLARFNNGLLYKFIAGDVCTAADLRKREIYCPVAEKLGQWHGSLSIDAISDLPMSNGHSNGRDIDSEPTIPYPNMWSVLRSWIDALPAQCDEQRQRAKQIEQEYESLKSRLEHTRGLYGRDYIFSHCDLLCGNVIVQKPRTREGLTNGRAKLRISFIDYEYATPAPAAFDIANHFAEWGGLDCDYAAMPSRSQRREFLEHYVRAYRDHASPTSPDESIGPAVQRLHEQVDLFRGVPGFYWGVWALIQARISRIDFDYPSYAEKRFGEYYAWKGEADGSREAEGRDMPPRERAWSRE